VFRFVIVPRVPSPIVATWGKPKGVVVFACTVTALVLAAKLVPPTSVAFAAA
jgi:hypothetical protein